MNLLDDYQETWEIEGNVGKTTLSKRNKKKNHLSI